MNRVDEEEGWLPVRVTLGIDLACRAPHVASLADDQGRLVWTGRTFQSRVRDLEALWADLGCDPGELTVVMEPTRIAWAPVAACFKSRGVKVVLVPTTQSADLRAYYSQRTKDDRRSTPPCWPGCRCCTPRGCAPTPVRDRRTHCVGRPNSASRW